MNLCVCVQVVKSRLDGDLVELERYVCKILSGRKNIGWDCELDVFEALCTLWEGGLGTLGRDGDLTPKGSTP